MNDNMEFIDVDLDENKNKKAASPERRKRPTSGSPESKRPESKGPETKRSSKKTSKNAGLTPTKIILRVLLVIVTFVLVTFIGLYMTLWTICHGPSKSARDLLISTLLETGQMKFVASWYFNEEEILAITNRNALVHNDANVDPDLIQVAVPDNSGNEADTDFDINGIEIVELTGRSYYAKLMIVNDPSRVKLATIYPWSDFNQSKYGETLENIVNAGNYLAGVNGGEYYSAGNWGGVPKGLVVCESQILYNVPEPGDVMVGFNEDNILMVMDIGGMSSEQVAAMVAEKHIRDAVSFKDIDDGDNNHFTKLIINGEARQISGNGSGANPRTVIGQRADGAVLLLVTDGRGASGHLGATALDLISIMQEYGAVNAANLDGGSSSAMYYNGAYEMTSVTLYYSTSSWRLPDAFVVERRGE